MEPSAYGFRSVSGWICCFERLCKRLTRVRVQIGDSQACAAHGRSFSQNRSTAPLLNQQHQRNDNHDQSRRSTDPARRRRSRLQHDL